MKGILKLTDIQSPVEGMQVVLNNQVWEKLQYDNVETGQGWAVYNGGVGTDVLDISKLKQIVVEYYKQTPGTDMGYKTTYVEKTTLSLHPEDWKWAIEHIGEEVEFKFKTGELLESDEHDQKYEVLAKLKKSTKLIHPTPVTYTRQDMVDFAQKMLDEDHVTAEYYIDEWTNKHKKK